MNWIKLAFLTGLSLFAAHAAAAPASAARPTPEAMHQTLNQISQDPARLKAALKNGQQAGAVCRHCHGAGGNSVMPEVPNLAGQNAAYLLEQMNKFAHGQRKSAFMEGLIKALAPDERIDIALFLSRQPVVRKPAGHSAQSDAGKNVYAKLCASCHGASGAGTEKIPRLAGQQTVYLEDSLRRYRSGSGERIDAKMAAYTRNLKDADIRNLATYLATLQP